ncbi:MAG: type I-F CRISPR-associated protein Csy1, partial [bacterium]
EEERAADLPEFQKIWLDEAKEEQRDSEDEWLMKVEKALARWILLAYRKVLGKQAKQLGDDELAHIHKIIRANEEGLR